ncbi:MAG: DUF3800 domain-containing protein [Candidatus Yanofskybacteria bacterium]|nr:DUF3800 domain-containing protein [Candidatus Yanofskybacteria bacterium]
MELGRRSMSAMPSIFLDESGDLGFRSSKSGSSRFFVVTVMFIPGSVRPVEKVVSKTHAYLNAAKGGHPGVLHAVNESPAVRKYLLKLLSKRDCKVMAIVLNKKKVFTKLHEEKAVLYNFVTNILLERIYARHIVPTGDAIDLVASKRETNKFLNENFKDYLRRQVTQRKDGELRVHIQTPAQHKALQAVDFASWAIFRKHEKGDPEYCNIIRNIVVEESPLFP